MRSAKFALSPMNPSGWLMMAAVMMASFLGACSDPPKNNVETEQPCGGACPPEECRFGTCIDNGDDAGNNDQDADDPNNDQDADDPNNDQDADDKTCAGDGDCADDEFCNIAGMNDEGVCEPGCRTEPDNCGEGEVCDEESHACVDEPDGCTEDADCAEGSFCDLSDGTPGQCVEGCRSDEECQPGEVCEEGQCLGVPCEQDIECPPNNFCDEDAGRCVAGCEDDSNCEAGLTCQGGQCVGEACDDDADCEQGFFCNQDTGFCSVGCVLDEDCLDGQICAENQCITGCRTDDVCLPGEYCEVESASCVEGCREDAECLPGESCQLTDIGDGVERQRCGETICTADADCVEGFFCNVPQGEAEGVCDEGCREDDCDPGEVCDLDSRLCEQAPCEDSSECDEGFYCDPDLDTPLCVPGCDSDLQCGGQPCNLDTNTCGCNENADCPGQQVCSLGQCIPRCTEQDDCGDGFFCDVESGFCLEGCLDDGLEPNDTINGALPITEGDFELRMCYEAQIGQDFRDCFSVSLNDLDTLEVSIDFSHAEGNLDLRLYNALEVPVRISDSLNDGEEFSFEANGAGDFVFCIEPQGGAFELDYSLSVTVTPGQGCLDDVDEANGNNTCQDVANDALPLVVGEPFDVEGRSICPGDRDFVAVEMRSGQQLDVTLTRTQGNEDLDVRVIDADCDGVLAQTENIGDVRTLTFQAPANGTYRVEVFGELPTFTGSYNLGLLLGAGDAQCPEDIIEDLPVEPNEDAAGSTILRFNRNETYQLDGLSMCADDEDWYRIVITVPSDVIRATLSQSVNGVPLEVAIINTDGTTVMDSANEASPIKSAESLPVPQTGSYFVRVRPTAPVPEAGLEYNLSLQVAAANACVPDQFEPNNAFEAASLVSSGSFTASMCREDALESDFYRIQLGTGDRMNITLEYDHDIISPLSELPMLLYNPNGEPVDFGIRGGENIDVLLSGEVFVGPSNQGEWVLEINAGDAGESFDYTLNIDIVSPSCEEVEDDFEPNESCGGAASLNPFTSQRGFICGPTGDEDWFGVDVAANQTLSIHLDYFHFDGNIDLEIYAPGGNTRVDESYNRGPNFEDVSVDNTVAGRYCVRVFGTSPLLENRYTIEATIE